MPDRGTGTRTTDARRRWPAARAGLAAAMVAAATVAALPAPAAEVGDLVAAYPERLAGIEAGVLVWKDGTRMPLSDGRPAKSFAEKLKAPSLADQMSLAYPSGPFRPPAGSEDDPGRFRNAAFFDRMYGDCTRGEVERNLVAVAWLPKSGGVTVRITRLNGVAARLKAVSDAIDALPAEIRRAAYPSAGTYNCRAVQDTGARSAHGWGIAIDLNTKVSDYWLWAGGAKGGLAPYRNRIPLEIVAAFEREGFIWGGRWAHFDTMHFEYRPELLPQRR